VESDRALMPTGASPDDVILVDDEDRALGTCGKLEAHRRGLLHRAVSVFAFDAEGRLLVQRRADGKYHSGGLWSNSACTHPRVGESLEQAAERALREELGLTARRLRRTFATTYRIPVGRELTEHELDHVFVCDVSGPVAPSPAEVVETAWRDAREVLGELQLEPERFTPWFGLLLSRVVATRATAT
jgi:isopentenyl-diphosphate delta-isomerase